MKDEQTTHTPGPWRWVGCYLLQDCPARDGSGDKEDNPFSTPCGYPIADDGSAGGEYNVCIDIDGPDARLIAAAPEMLQALKHALGFMEMSAVADECDPVRAAIAKAEGQP